MSASGAPFLVLSNTKPRDQGFRNWQFRQVGQNLRDFHGATLEVVPEQFYDSA